MRIKRADVFALLSLFTICMGIVFSGAGCGLFGKKETFPTIPQKPNQTPRTGISGPRTATDTVKSPALQLTGNKEWNGAGTGQAPEAAKQSEPDLIKESGFDMIYPNFNKETGRPDPFVPVSLSAGPLDVIRQMTPEKFRVIGTAMTPTGQIAMIEVGEQTKIVREGDVLDSGHVIKSITRYDVVLDKDSRQLRLTMFTRKRIAKDVEEAKMPKLPGLNINDLYVQYLKDKYSEETEGQEGEKSRPKSFNEFLNTEEKGLANKVLQEENNNSR